eukprot:gene3205-2187_t
MKNTATTLNTLPSHRFTHSYKPTNTNTLSLNHTGKVLHSTQMSINTLNLKPSNITPQNKQTVNTKSTLPPTKIPQDLPHKQISKHPTTQESHAQLYALPNNLTDTNNRNQRLQSIIQTCEFKTLRNKPVYVNKPKRKPVQNFTITNKLDKVHTQYTYLSKSKARRIPCHVYTITVPRTYGATTSANTKTEFRLSPKTPNTTNHPIQHMQPHSIPALVTTNQNQKPQTSHQQHIPKEYTLPDYCTPRTNPETKAYHAQTPWCEAIAKMQPNRKPRNPPKPVTHGNLVQTTIRNTQQQLQNAPTSAHPKSKSNTPDPMHKYTYKIHSACKFMSSATDTLYYINPLVTENHAATQKPIVRKTTNHPPATKLPHHCYPVKTAIRKRHNTANKNLQITATPALSSQKFQHQQISTKLEDCVQCPNLLTAQTAIPTQCSETHSRKHRKNPHTSEIQRTRESPQNHPTSTNLPRHCYPGKTTNLRPQKKSVHGQYPNIPPRPRASETSKNTNLEISETSALMPVRNDTPHPSAHRSFNSNKQAPNLKTGYNTHTYQYHKPQHVPSTPKPIRESTENPHTPEIRKLRSSTNNNHGHLTHNCATHKPTKNMIQTATQPKYNLKHYSTGTSSPYQKYPDPRVHSQYPYYRTTTNPPTVKHTFHNTHAAHDQTPSVQQTHNAHLSTQTLCKPTYGKPPQTPHINPRKATNHAAHNYAKHTTITLRQQEHCIHYNETCKNNITKSVNQTYLQAINTLTRVSCSYNRPHKVYQSAPNITAIKSPSNSTIVYTTHSLQHNQHTPIQNPGSQKQSLMPNLQAKYSTRSCVHTRQSTPTTKSMSTTLTTRTNATRACCQQPRKTGIKYRTRPVRKQRTNISQTHHKKLKQSSKSLTQAANQLTKAKQRTACKQSHQEFNALLVGIASTHHPRNTTKESCMLNKCLQQSNVRDNRESANVAITQNKLKFTNHQQGSPQT